MKLPLISIIIPIYNTGETVVKLLNQLVQDIYENLEIIAWMTAQKMIAFLSCRSFADNRN